MKAGNTNKFLRMQKMTNSYESKDDVSDWTDVKTYLPEFSRMVWAACPNAVLCAHQTFLLYMDSDGQWRDNRGYLFSGKVNFWQYADVPECNISC